jgi:hypothetical protein
MRRPSTKREPLAGGSEKLQPHTDLPPARRACQAVLDNRARLHVARCAACTAALATGGELCSDGERLANEAARHAERTRPSTTETQTCHHADRRVAP